jgi:hypothetical protein
MKGLQRLVHLLGGVEKLDHGALGKIYEYGVSFRWLSDQADFLSLSQMRRSERSPKQHQTNLCYVISLPQRDSAK